MSEKKSDLANQSTKSEVTTIDVSKKLLSREEKKQALLDSMTERNQLQIPEEYKEHGYYYRLVNVMPGNIEMYKSMGFEVVTHRMRTNGTMLKPGVNEDTPVEQEVGGAQMGTLKAIWMRCTAENKEILDEIRDDKARAMADLINQDPIPEENRAVNSKLTQGTNIGRITREII